MIANQESPLNGTNPGSTADRNYHGGADDIYFATLNEITYIAIHFRLP